MTPPAAQTSRAAALGPSAAGVAAAPTLTLGPGLELPYEAVTETFAILAKRGSGKTYCASVMVEELHAAGLPVVVVDPIGVWWGLRSSADGKGDGLPFVVFGGDHADVPLEVTAGELLADLVVDERLPAVLDLSSLSKGMQRRFMTSWSGSTTATGTRCTSCSTRPTRSLRSAPAPTWHGSTPPVEDLVRRGRARGLGCTLITQRPVDCTRRAGRAVPLRRLRRRPAS